MTVKPKRYAKRGVMSEIIRRSLVWLRRIRHCQGFGVQSPWAFDMVRNVINEHHPYYAYQPLAEHYPSMTRRERRLCQLYLRLANNVQPDIVLNNSKIDVPFADYVKAGCHKARILNAVNITAFGSLEGTVMARLQPCDNLSEYVEKLCANAKNGWLMIIEGIHGDKNTCEQWAKIVKERPFVVTFDLYYCGLVFFDTKRYKQNYIINF